jgi:hypothetical protein
LHFDGTEWRAVPVPVDTPLYGVWGSGPNDAWAVGAVILHYQGPRGQ